MTPAAFEPRLREYVRGMTFKAWVLHVRRAPAAAGADAARVLSRGGSRGLARGSPASDPAHATKRPGGSRAPRPRRRTTPPRSWRWRGCGWLKIGPTKRGRRSSARRGSRPRTSTIQYGAGVAALQYLDRATGARQVELEQRAHDALTRAAALAPNSPDTFAWLAYAELRQRAWNEAARAISRAIGLAPGRTEFRLRQADIMILRGAPDVARPMLMEIAARSADKRLSRQRAAAVSRHSTRPGLPRRPRAAAEPRRRAGHRLILRRVQDGEQRVFGRLTAVECAARPSRALSRRGRRPRSRDRGGAVRGRRSRAVHGGKEATLGLRRARCRPIRCMYLADREAGRLARRASRAWTVAVEFLPRDFVP